jgi:hypothetical protein
LELLLNLVSNKSTYRVEEGLHVDSLLKLRLVRRFSVFI